MAAKLLLDKTINSELSEVRGLISLVLPICLELGFDEPAQAEIELAICEALNNAIIHAHSQEKTKEVRVRLLSDQQRLTIEISDQSNAPFCLPCPKKCSNTPPSLNTGGRGLMIIQTVMEEVSLKQTSCGNTIKMSRKLEAKPNL